MVYVNILDYYENFFERVWVVMKDLRYEYMLFERVFFFYDLFFKDEINEKFLKKLRDFLIEIIKYN